MADEKTPKAKTSPPVKPAKVFDVAKPAETPAAATSRPVIVGHTNSMQTDPMVAPVAESTPIEAKTEKEILYDKPKSEKKLQPVSDSEAADPKSQPVEEAPAEPQASDEATPETNESSEEKEAGSDSAAVEALVSGLNTKKEREKQEEKEAKIQEELRAMAASKKYYVKTHMAPSKRKFRGVVTLLLLVVLGALGWYFGLGPGKDMWSSTEPVTPAATEIVPTPSQATPAEAAPKAEEKVVFSDPALGITFEHPKNWQIEKSKDSEFATRDKVTIKSPVETIKTSAKNSPSVDAEVFLRTTIVVENTVNPSEYASDLVSLSTCSSEDVIVAGTTMRLLYLDSAQEAPNVSQVSLSLENCTGSGNVFNANDQVQLPTKKNTYIVYTEYVFSEAYLQKVGSTSEQSIKTAQASGVVVTKEAFKAGTQFAAFQEMIKSFKEL